MGSTDWLIISLSITRKNALLTGMSLSIATAVDIDLILYAVCWWLTMTISRSATAV